MSMYNAKDYYMAGLNFPSEVRLVTTTSDTQGSKTFWDRWFKPHRNHYKTLIAAEAALAGGCNEVIMVSPELHALPSMLTWDKSNSALIGMAPEGCLMNQRSRIEMSADFVTMMTVSGDGNLFKNLYFMHGRGTATNLNCLTVSGDRNTFVNCHFAGPQATAEATAAGYDLIRLTTAEETTFKNCVIGNTTIGSTTVALVEKQTGSGSVIFDDCIFIINSNHANNTVLKLDTGIMARPIIFRNCMGIISGTQITLAITGDFLDKDRCVYLYNTDFYNAADVASHAANEAYTIGMGSSTLRTTDELIGLGTAYDATA